MEKRILEKRSFHLKKKLARCPLESRVVVARVELTGARPDRDARRIVRVDAHISLTG
jgi:hypothetical protein